MGRADRCRQRASSGFGLAETVLAGLIIGLVVLALAGLYSTGLMTIHRSSQRLVAGQLAQSMLEESRDVPVSGIPVGTRTLAERVANATRFIRVLQADPDPADPGLLHLQARVTWEEQKVVRTVTRELWICDVRR